MREIEEKILAHLKAQGRQAVKGCGCGYRTDDGLRCAVGCLIADEHYNPACEGGAVNGLTVEPEGWGGSAGVLCDLRKNTMVALAECLNASGVPASEWSKRVLAEWQFRHDRECNWCPEEGYIGPTDFLS